MQFSKHLPYTWSSFSKIKHIKCSNNWKSIITPCGLWLPLLLEEADEVVICPADCEIGIFRDCSCTVELLVTSILCWPEETFWPLGFAARVTNLAPPPDWTGNICSRKQNPMILYIFNIKMYNFVCWIKLTFH